MDHTNDDRSTKRKRLHRHLHGLLLILLISGCAGRTAAGGGDESSMPATPKPVAVTSAPAPTDTAVPTASRVPVPTARPSDRPPPTPTSAAPAPTPVCPSFVAAPIKPPAADAVMLAARMGQKLIVRMDGTTPGADLLNRIGSGQIGGVILFGTNITTAEALTALTSRLQAAAAAGDQPPLLIATDQEGGSIQRIPWAPPTLSPPQMGADGRTSVARDQGAAGGSALAALGINVDLAPVADVPSSAASFIYLQGRAFSFDPSITAALAGAFASGLESSGVVPVVKHFPGLGLALANTDAHALTITEPMSALMPGLEPYRTAIAAGLPMVMLSNATYSALDACNGAGWSSLVGNGLLREQLGFTGVTITDSLTGTAIAAGTSDSVLAVRAAAAGTDLILVTGSEKSSRAVYAALLAAAQAGTIPLAAIEASNTRIEGLKSGL